MLLDLLPLQVVERSGSATVTVSSSTTASGATTSAPPPSGGGGRPSARRHIHKPPITATGTATIGCRTDTSATGYATRTGSCTIHATSSTTAAGWGVVPYVDPEDELLLVLDLILA